MEKLTKVTMNLSQRTIDNVDLINGIIKAKNKTQAVSTAIEIAKIILTEIQNGNKIKIEQPDGNIKEISFKNAI